MSTRHLLGGGYTGPKAKTLATRASDAAAIPCNPIPGRAELWPDAVGGAAASRSRARPCV